MRKLEKITREIAEAGRDLSYVDTAQSMLDRFEEKSAKLKIPVLSDSESHSLIRTALGDSSLWKLWQTKLAPDLESGWWGFSDTARSLWYSYVCESASIFSLGRPILASISSAKKGAAELAYRFQIERLRLEKKIDYWAPSLFLKNAMLLGVRPRLIREFRGLISNRKTGWLVYQAHTGAMTNDQPMQEDALNNLRGITYSKVRELRPRIVKLENNQNPLTDDEQEQFDQELSLTILDAVDSACGSRKRSLELLDALLDGKLGFVPDRAADRLRNKVRDKLHTIDFNFNRVSDDAEQYSRKEAMQRAREEEPDDGRLRRFADDVRVAKMLDAYTQGAKTQEEVAEILGLASRTIGRWLYKLRGEPEE